MYLTHKFKMSHQELINYIKLYLASCGITEYDCYENSYDTDSHYGFKEHWDTCKISGLPAPFNIGHIQIDIVNAHISFRLVIQHIIKLNEEEQKLHKKEFIKSSDDIWVFEPEGYSHDERWIIQKTGYNVGYEIHEHNIQKFNDFLNTIFKEKYNVHFVVQLAAECYEKSRNIKDFEELAANAWHMYKKLWNTINFFSTQWGETSRISLSNKYNLNYVVEN